MSADLYRVLYTADQVLPVRRRRQWLDVGEPMMVAGVIIRPMHHGGELPDLEICDADHGRPGACPLMAMSFSTPYRLIPRAVRIDDHGRVTAVLFETQYTGNNKPGWDNTHNEDDCNAKLSQISDRR